MHISDMSFNLCEAGSWAIRMLGMKREGSPTVPQCDSNIAYALNKFRLIREFQTRISHKAEGQEAGKEQYSGAMSANQPAQMERCVKRRTCVTLLSNSISVIEL